MHFLFILLQSVSILILGHSFGVDCTEYLPNLAHEAGIETLTIGRFNKGNCSLAEHHDFFVRDTVRNFGICAPGQVKYKNTKKTYKSVFSEMKWDYIIFQTSLENQGRYETFQPYLNEMVEFARKAQKEKFGNEPVIAWNLFWPISKLLEDGSHKVCKYRLSFYENSSEKMWEAYKNAAKTLTKETGIDFIIPTGEAVMLFRASKLNTPEAKELTRDGYHMSMGGGRYLAACTMFEKILTPIYHKSVVGNSFRVDKSPVPVTDGKTAMALQKLAKKAVKQPLK